MLTCKEQVARSSDYLDDQLSFREKLMVRHHLMFCPNCRRFMRQMRLMQATLKAMPEKPLRSPAARIAVTIPTTSPAALTSGPPELPGFTAASNWIRSRIVCTPPGARYWRSVPETTPALTEGPMP